MPKVVIDGRSYDFAEGSNLLEACLSVGLDLPYFCWHPAMGSVGACRQCAVVQYQDEHDERGRLVMGCMTRVSEGARFSLGGDRARHFRRAVIESLMINHPHDCPVCAEGGECHLQDMTVMTGHRDRRYRGPKRTFRNQYLGPLVHHEMNRCITCYRCTRFYRDYAGGTDLAAMASRDRVYFGRHEEGVLESEFSGNLVEVCPTGVFTDRTLVGDYTRKWDLQSAPSICQGCAAGCNTSPGERYGRLKRVHNRYNGEVNGYFLCDRGRYGHGWVNHDRRLRYSARAREDGSFDAIDADASLALAADWLRAGPVAGVGSPRASLESNFLLRELVGAEHCAPGVSGHDYALCRLALSLSAGSTARVPSLREVEQADAVLIVGEDVTATAPRLALALRQSVRNLSKALAAEAGLMPWQDAAVRNLAQFRRNPLYILASTSTRLDDIAEGRETLAPEACTRFVEDLVGVIRGERSAQPGSRLEAIAKALRSAKRPLLVSGVSAGDGALLEAVTKLADTLARDNKEAGLSLIVPEVNSLGMAMLFGTEPPDFENLIREARAGRYRTLLVLENDLFERGDAATVEALLESFEHVVVIDALETRTAERSGLVLAAASPIESSGTVVSLEGRAQRYFPVMTPREQSRESWRWLADLLKVTGDCGYDADHSDAVLARCAATVPGLAAICSAAPGREFRRLGRPVPRQPHRYSGRTAMFADRSVHEPQQPTDPDTPLSYTMEGYDTGEATSLRGFVWAPGWNSNHSLHRFQQEVGGALRGGDPGVRLLDGGTAFERPRPLEPRIPDITEESGHWRLVAQPVLFGSEPRSALSAGVEELVPAAFIALSPVAAQQLAVSEGDGVTVDGQRSLEVRIDPGIADACAAFAPGLAGCEGLAAGQRVVLARDASWRRRDADLIARAGGSHGG